MGEFWGLSNRCQNVVCVKWAFPKVVVKVQPALGRSARPAPVRTDRHLPRNPTPTTRPSVISHCLLPGASRLYPPDPINTRTIDRRTHRQSHTHINTHTYTPVHTFTHIHTYSQTHTHTHTHARTHTPTHTHTHTQTNTHIHTHTTHTHNHKESLYNRFVMKAYN